MAFLHQSANRIELFINLWNGVDCMRAHILDNLCSAVAAAAPASGTHHLHHYDCNMICVQDCRYDPCIFSHMPHYVEAS